MPAQKRKFAETMTDLSLDEQPLQKQPRHPNRTVPQLMNQLKAAVASLTPDERKDFYNQAIQGIPTEHLEGKPLCGPNRAWKIYKLVGIAKLNLTNHELHVHLLHKRKSPRNACKRLAVENDDPFQLNTTENAISEAREAQRLQKKKEYSEIRHDVLGNKDLRRLFCDFYRNRTTKEHITDIYTKVALSVTDLEDLSVTDLLAGQGERLNWTSDWFMTICEADLATYELPTRTTALAAQPPTSSLDEYGFYEKIMREEIYNLYEDDSRAIARLFYGWHWDQLILAGEIFDGPYGEAPSRGAVVAALAELDKNFIENERWDEEDAFPEHLNEDSVGGHWATDLTGEEYWQEE